LKNLEGKRKKWNDVTRQKAGRKDDHGERQPGGGGLVEAKGERKGERKNKKTERGMFLDSTSDGAN